MWSFLKTPAFRLKVSFLLVLLAFLAYGWKCDSVTQAMFVTLSRFRLPGRHRGSRGRFENVCFRAADGCLAICLLAPLGRNAKHPFCCSFRLFGSPKSRLWTHPRAPPKVHVIPAGGFSYALQYCAFPAAGIGRPSMGMLCIPAVCIGAYAPSYWSASSLQCLHGVKY